MARKKTKTGRRKKDQVQAHRKRKKFEKPTKLRTRSKEVGLFSLLRGFKKVAKSLTGKGGRKRKSSSS